MSAWFTSKSLGLLFVAVVLAALVGLDRRPVAEVEERGLPSLPVVAVDDVVRIVIGDQINQLTLEREGKDAPWRLVSPLQYAADEQVVGAFVRALAAGVPMDTQVDEGNLETYGVDDQHALRADLYTDAAEPAVSVIVGKSAGPDSAFVRLPGSETVYRAAVGARSRFERAAGDWRDRTLVTLDRDAVRAFTIERPGATLRFTRGAARTGPDGAARPGAWSLEGAAFPVDDQGVELMVNVLAKLRAAEIHAPSYEAGLDAPAAGVVLEGGDGRTHRITLGSRVDARAAWVRVDDRPEVFRVSPKVRTALLLDVAALRDLSLAGFDAQAVDSAAWTEGSLTIAATWNPEALRWVVTQPANVEVDQKAFAAAVAQLAGLRALGIAPDATFTPSGAQVRVQLRDGARWQLDLARPESDGKLVRARVSGRDEVFVLEVRLLTEIRGAFGR